MKNIFNRIVKTKFEKKTADLKNWPTWTIFDFATWRKEQFQKYQLFFPKNINLFLSSF